MSEIEPVDEACFLVEACAVDGRFVGFHHPNFFDTLEEQGFVRRTGQRVAITAAGKAQLKRLIDQLTRSVPMSEIDAWQPIETAPLGQWLLLAGDPWGDYPPIAVGRSAQITEDWWEQVSKTRKELRTVTRTEWDVEGLCPTHWKHLPEVPNV